MHIKCGQQDAIISSWMPTKMAKEGGGKGNWSSIKCETSLRILVAIEYVTKYNMVAPHCSKARKKNEVPLDVDYIM